MPNNGQHGARIIATGLPSRLQHPLFFCILYFSIKFCFFFIYVTFSYIGHGHGHVLTMAKQFSIIIIIVYNVRNDIHIVQIYNYYKYVQVHTIREIDVFPSIIITNIIVIIETRIYYNNKNKYFSRIILYYLYLKKNYK